MYVGFDVFRLEPFRTKDRVAEMSGRDIILVVFRGPFAVLSVKRPLGYDTFHEIGSALTAEDVVQRAWRL
jgi:hypothetical protein